jgi:hypothetical protein
MDPHSALKTVREHASKLGKRRHDFASNNAFCKTIATALRNAKLRMIPLLDKLNQRSFFKWLNTMRYSAIGLTVSTIVLFFLWRSASSESARWEHLGRFGDSDPRHISATFAKIIEEREVTAQIDIHCFNMWQLGLPLSAKPAHQPNNKGKEFQITGTRVINYPIRNGLFLGSFSDMCFFMVSIPDPNVDFVRPNAIKMVPENSNEETTVSYRDLFALTTFQATFHKRGERYEWEKNRGAIVHAWRSGKEGSPILLVVGFEGSAKSGTSALPYQPLIETKDDLYPVSSLNGAVSLLPLSFEREYDHRGVEKSWNGFPGDIRMVFSPIEKFDQPVVHSYILQRDQSNSFWIPAYAVQTHLKASLDELALNWIQGRATIDSGSPITLPIGVPSQIDGVKIALPPAFQIPAEKIVKQNEARRTRLLESFRELVNPQIPK